jgi:DNA (cytosine-5)-methyltransferase 1
MDYTDLPQNRERIYIVGFRDQADADRFHLFEGDDICGTNLELDALRHDRNKAQWEQITAGLLDYNTVNIQNNSKYYYTPQKYPHYYVAPEDYDGVYDEYHNRVNLAEQVNEMYQFYQIRRGMYVRKNKSNVCPTLTANMGTGGHNVPLILDHSGVRKLTPGETFKLQGFPVGNGYTLPDKVDNKAYADSHLYKQAGNAVSVPMIKLIAEAILAAL